MISTADIKKKLLVVMGQVEDGENVDLMAAIKWLDQVTENNSTTLPKRLAHFLQKRSYVKALAFIEEEYNGS